MDRICSRCGFDLDDNEGATCFACLHHEQGVKVGRATAFEEAVKLCDEAAQRYRDDWESYGPGGDRNDCDSREDLACELAAAIRALALKAGGG